jgi:hypothetical protein
MTKRRDFTLFLFCATLLSAVIAQPATQYYCCIYENQAQPDILAAACTSMYCPSQITGWGAPIKQHESSSCEFCPKYFSNDVQETPVVKEVATKPMQDDPVPCCVYSDPNQGYFQPIYTIAVNPEGGDPECPDNTYGLPLLGEWYVATLYNECYFIPNGTGSAI